MSPKRIYHISRLVSALFMILALLWLTVSAPFVLASQQHLSKNIQTENSSFPETEEDSTNPFGNNTEEKVPSSTSLSEEYLHHQQYHESFFTELLSSFGIRNDGTYIAYHGELLVPPPNLS